MDVCFHMYIPNEISQVALVVKNLPVNAGDIRDMHSVPGLGRSPGVWTGNPLQYSCLENPMDRGAWWAIGHRVTKSQTQLKWLGTHALKAQFKCLPSRKFPWFCPPTEISELSLCSFIAFACNSLEINLSIPLDYKPQKAKDQLL